MLDEMLCLVRCCFQRPVVERCYGLSARSRNESISACWPVGPGARGPALEIQMAAAIIPSQMTAALLHSSCCSDLFCPILSRAGQVRDDD